MTSSDIPAVLVIEQEAYPHPWTDALFEECLQRDNYKCSLIIERLTVLGYCIGAQQDQQCHVMNLTVKRPARLAGLGRQLLQNLLSWAGEQQMTHITLEVRDTNHAAKALYQSMGFLSVATRADYYPTVDGREDAIIMTKIL